MKEQAPVNALDFVTFGQAAGLLRISLRQFRRLVDSGKVPYVKVSERSPRVRVEDLNSYLASVTVRHSGL